MQPSNPLSHSPPRARLGLPFLSMRPTAVLLFVAVALLPAPLATGLVIAPVAEELVFRAGLQAVLMRWLRGRAGAAQIGNAMTACAFAAAHIALHPGPLALLTVFPALFVGRVYQRHRRLAPCIAWHALFNTIWLLWAAIPA